MSKITAAKSDGTAIELTVDEENASVTATFTLKGGESLTISNIPAGAKYTVSESYAENYETTVEGNESGTIAVGANVVTYTNTYVEPETPTEPETPEETEPETPDEEKTETTEEVEEEPTETVVEAVTDPVTTTSAETGDNSAIILLVVLAVACGTALCVIKNYRKKNINI